MNWKTLFTSVPGQLEATPADLTISYLDNWSVIEASGADRKSFLQGQITCDLISLKQDEITFGAHCDAKGKVWSVFRVFEHQEKIYMVQPESAIEKELTELKKYAIFSKIELSKTEKHAFAIMGTNANIFVDSLSEDSSSIRNLESGVAVKLDENVWLLFVDEQGANSLSNTTNATLADSSWWTQYEILKGHPIVEAHQQIEHIPQAMNVQAINGISFTKGCYTGQETIARAKYRGANRRELAILKGKIAPETDTIEIERSVGDNWRSASVALTSVRYPDNSAVATFVLPNNLDDDVRFRLAGQDELTWTKLPLPYSLEDE